MALGTRRTPERNSPLLGGVPVVRSSVATVTAGSTLTLTAAQLLKGLLPINCTDSSTTTLPTAALLAAALPGIAAGDYFEVQTINYGDSTCTLAMGSGITNKTIDSEDAVLLIATHEALRFALVCTQVADPSDPSKADAFDFYGYGVTSAATS